jgi:hypothetical protein
LGPALRPAVEGSFDFAQDDSPLVAYAFVLSARTRGAAKGRLRDRLIRRRRQNIDALAFQCPVILSVESVSRSEALSQSKDPTNLEIESGAAGRSLDGTGCPISRAHFAREVGILTPHNH